MFRMIGFGENIGSGFPTILEAWKKENWNKPFLEERTDLRIVELTLPMVSLIPEECHTALSEIYGDSYLALSNEERLTLATALSEDGTSNYRLQQLLGKNSLDVGKILYALVKKEMLITTNKGRWTSYYLNHEFSQGTEKSRSKSQGVKVKEPKSQGAEKSRSKKWQSVVEKIYGFCKQPRTLQEIADYLKYADKYRMKRIYIDPLLGTSLEMTSSASKTSPLQKYVALQTKPTRQATKKSRS